MLRLPAVLLLFSSLAGAQAGETIKLDVVVTSKHGAPVAELKQQDFTLLDNKVARPITSFKAFEHDAPAEVILVLDAANSGQVSLANQRQQLNKFLTANGGKLALPTTIAILTDKGMQALGGSTRDGNDLAKIMNSEEIAIRFINRSSGFYGAEERLTTSLQGLRLLTANVGQRPERKLMIWISPGWPIISGFNVELSRREQAGLFSEIVDFSTLLRRANVVLYAVDPIGAGEGLVRKNYYTQFTHGISKPTQTEAGDLALQVLVEQSGGLVMNSGNDIAAMLDSAVRDAAPYYEITFDGPPAEQPNVYHQLQVKVDRPDVKARTRESYYAQPRVDNGDNAPGKPATK